MSKLLCLHIHEWLFHSHGRRFFFFQMENEQTSTVIPPDSILPFSLYLWITASQVYRSPLLQDPAECKLWSQLVFKKWNRSHKSTCWRDFPVAHNARLKNICLLYKNAHTAEGTAPLGSLKRVKVEKSINKLCAQLLHRLTGDKRVQL